MVAVIAFFVGGIVGALISRSLSSPDKQKELENSLAEARRELDNYHQDVAQHFAETSRLVNNLTQSYKDVHEHLAKGAIQLTNSEISKQILAAGDGQLGIEADAAIDEESFQPPRDWAPKTPGSKGTLSEDYGLNEENDEEAAIKSVAERHREAS